MASATSTQPNLSVAALDQAVDTILQNNFDADTKACFITLMKVLDNVIQKPFDPKVRSIRLSNPAFTNKVASRKGGVEFLIACGFVQESPTPALLARDDTPQESFLILKDVDESIADEAARADYKQAYTSHIITARRLLLTRATKDLHLKAEELPSYKPPPPPVAMNNHFTSENDQKSSGTFNPYQTHRYDGMSAAAGTQLTPDGNYVSPTEAQLKNLQQKQEKLEKQLQKDLMDREWIATPPNSSGRPTNILTADAATGNSDGGLIAAQFQKQQADKKQREEGGFTTKTMRDLERLKKQKVYSHTIIALQFSDGTVVQGKFLPKESIQTVQKALLAQCFVETPPANISVELYVTPPRKTLAPKATLQAEGLVPAAKVFVKMALPDHRPFLKPELFRHATGASVTQAFPQAQPIVPDARMADATSKKPAGNPKTTAEEREETLMQRMLGGGRRLGGGAGNTSSDAKKPKPGGKPKWFK